MDGPRSAVFTRTRGYAPLIERCPRNHPESRMQSGSRYEFFIRRTWPRHRNEISALKATSVEKFRVPPVIPPSPPSKFPPLLRPRIQVAVSIVEFQKISNLLHWERSGWSWIDCIAKIKCNNFVEAICARAIYFSLEKYEKEIFFNEGNFVITMWMNLLQFWESKGNRKILFC